MSERTYGYVLSGLLATERLAELAGRAETLGYDSLWITVLAGSTDAPAAIREALLATDRIEVGLGLVPVGVVPLDQLASEIRRSGAVHRAVVAIGAGQVRTGAAARVTAELRELSERLPDLALAAGGYGPRVLARGGAVAGSLLLNWSSPAHTDWALTQGALDRGPEQSPVSATVYVPISVGPDARTVVDDHLAVMAGQPTHANHQDTWGRSSLGFAARSFPEASAALDQMRRPDRRIVALPLLEDPLDTEDFMVALAPGAAAMP